MDDPTWASVQKLVGWLDSESKLPGQMELLLRIMKLSEEVGEVAEAVNGVLGQNPRKGVCATWEDVQHELCDVILTAMVALASLTPDARLVFDRRLGYVAGRCQPNRESQLDH